MPNPLDSRQGLSRSSGLSKVVMTTDQKSNNVTSDDTESSETITDVGSEEIGIKEPPESIGGILKQLGPGLIVAGSIVGSGELIATTVTGAKAGFWLLWLILIGCVIKVFVQVEMGRYSLATGRTAMDGFDDVPGPRIKKHGNWLIWYWFIMFVAGIGQLGGIVGGVGQALSISYPMTQYGKEFHQIAEKKTQLIIAERQIVRQQDAELRSTLHVEFSESLLEYIELLLPHYVPEAKQTSEAYLEQLRSNRLASLSTFLKDNPGSGIEMFNGMAIQDSIDKIQAKQEQRTLTAAENEKLEKLVAQLNEDPQRKGITDLRADLSDPYDDEIWAGLVTLVTIGVLVVGRFTLIQNFSTALVAMFTVVTIVNLFLLQSNPDWGFSLNDVLTGLKFQLPPESDQGLSIALMAFGIIGVGASELVMYPYWCQEKGYGRFVGPNDGSKEWMKRANGWMRVMRWDAWCSMIVYTFATVAFYLLGASILWRTGLTPEGNDTIRYLAVMYEPVFGTVAQAVFLFGAIAVLYSTFFVANAAHARTFSDALRVMGLAKRESYRKLVLFFSALFPTLCILIYIYYPKPVELVLISGTMQALMLPMLAGAAIYYRYYRIDDGLKPSRVWDLFLWVSAVGMLIAGLWLAWTKLAG